MDFITKHLNKLGYGLALAIIAFLLFNPRIEKVPIEYEEDPSMRDTTTVYKTVIDTVEVRDTVITHLEISEPIEEEDSVSSYTTTYTDDFIKAEITSKVKGTLLDQRLWYVRRVQHIRHDNTTTVTVDRYFKPVEIFTDPYRDNPKGIWGGINATDIGPNITFTPNIMLIRGNVAYELGYNLNEQSLKNFDMKAINAGIKFKLFN